MKVAVITFITLAAAAVATPHTKRDNNNAAKLYFPEDNETCIKEDDVFVCHEGRDADATVFDEAADNATLSERSFNDPNIMARFCPGCPSRCNGKGYCKSSCKGTWGVCKCSKKKSCNC